MAKGLTPNEYVSMQQALRSDDPEMDAWLESTRKLYQEQNVANVPVDASYEAGFRAGVKASMAVVQKAKAVAAAYTEKKTHARILAAARQSAYSTSFWLKVLADAQVVSKDFGIKVGNLHGHVYLLANKNDADVVGGSVVITGGPGVAEGVAHSEPQIMLAIQKSGGTPDMKWDSADWSYDDYRNEYTKYFYKA